MVFLAKKHEKACRKKVKSWVFFCENVVFFCEVYVNVLQFNVLTMQKMCSGFCNVLQISGLKMCVKIVVF